jgi:hypothetical protein
MLSTYRIRTQPNTGEQVHIIGDETMVLRGDYHDDQGWFPFMRGTVFIKPAPPPAPPRTACARQNAVEQHRANLRHRAKAEFVWIDGVYRNLWPRVDLTQLRLPFAHSTRMTKEEFETILQQCAPFFERTPSGGLATVPIHHLRLSEAKEWCDVNCRSFYFVNRPAGGITFQSLTEAAAVKLIFYERARDISRPLP